MIHSYYEGKNLFLTGCTGFVGKVLLEKILFSLPNINRIYVLIRTKKGSSAEERFKKEIVDSLLFERLRAREYDFDALIKHKVIPIAGDLLKDGLDLTQHDFLELSQNVHIIINSAASVDFNQRLDQAIQVNTLGSLRVLELAKACKNLTSLVQISTAYVNCDKQGWVDERIYPIAVDPRELLRDLLKVPVEEIEKRTPELIGNFPNTYTFTKNLTEQILNVERESIPICIVRPTIIGGGWKEPFPGWIDTVSAAATFYLAGGLGFLQFSLGKRNFVGDQIPVDTVVNAAITAVVHLCKPNEIGIMHIGTSARNPITWNSVINIVTSYWKKHMPEKAIARSNFKFIESQRTYDLVRLVKRRIPVYLFTKYAQIRGKAGLLKSAGRLKKMIEREVKISDSFAYFTCNQ